jgi:dTDP-4-amino-4,6-dideoxygalactose transaminase
MKPIMDLARKHKVAVIEDAAQALSSRYDGMMAGSIGDIGCFSFFPTKNLGGLGDGGMVTTNDDQLAVSLRKLRVHGAEPKYYHHIVGYNSRLDTIQAAALSVKLPYLDDWSKSRRAHASVYDRELKGLPIDILVQRSYGYHIYNQYTIGLDRRDAFREHLKSRQIGHEVYYPVPLHLQECYRDLGYREGSFPASERAAKRVCSLPIFPELRADEQAYVIQAARDFVSD